MAKIDINPAIGDALRAAVYLYNVKHHTSGVVGAEPAAHSTTTGKKRRRPGG